MRGREGRGQDRGREMKRRERKKAIKTIDGTSMVPKLVAGHLRANAAEASFSETSR